MVDGEVVADSGGIHPGVEKTSSSGAGVLGHGRHVTLRKRVGSGLGLGPGQVVAKVTVSQGQGRQGRQKLAPIPHTPAQEAGCDRERDSKATLTALPASGSGCSQS